MGQGIENGLQHITMAFEGCEEVFASFMSSLILPINKF